MSVSLYSYDPEKCDQADWCVGDCDLCSRRPEDEEDDDDG